MVSQASQEKVHGKKAFVIEAVPRSGDADGVRSVKIWIDKESFQILKSEIEGIPLEGYEDVLKDSVLLNIEPLFLTTHEYSSYFARKGRIKLYGISDLPPLNVPPLK